MIVKRSGGAIARKRLAVRAKRDTNNIEISVRKTGKHFYAVIYDCEKKTIVKSFSTLTLKSDKKTSSKPVKTWSTEVVKVVAKETSNFLKSNNIENIFFNKLLYKYHGKVALFVDCLRESGVTL